MLRLTSTWSLQHYARTSYNLLGLCRAIGERFHAILVDNGLLRLNEREQVLLMLKEKCGVNLRAVDASGE